MLFALRNAQKGNWIVEADLSGIKTSDIIFYAQPVVKTKEMTEREESEWTRKFEQSNGKLFNGPLAAIRDISKNGEKLQLGISKSCYKEHHGSCPVNGVQDDYTKQFFPYDFTIENGIARPKIPNFEKLFPAFAFGTMIETKDGRIIYLIRSDQVDSYKKTWATNAGGRINGTPHQVVDELVQDSTSIFGHIIGMLQQEYTDLDPKVVRDVRLLGLTRSLDDYDITVASRAKIDLPFSELERKLVTHNGTVKKYDGMGSVPANADGIITLLKSDKFPSTIYPGIVQAAQTYGVNPAEINKSIEKLN